MVKFIRERVLAGEVLLGITANLGSSITVEMIGVAGFDWIWIDGEHGMGGFNDLVHQLLAADATPAVPVVRVVWNDFPLIKRVLDLGAAGVIIPWINTPEEAEQAVRAMRYPPEGIRGVARILRANSYGYDFDAYYAHANSDLLTVVQVETVAAVEHAAQIAAVNGVDVLLVGPTDLSASMGIFGQFKNPEPLGGVRTGVRSLPRPRQGGRDPATGAGRHRPADRDGIFVHLEWGRRRPAGQCTSHESGPLPTESGPDPARHEHEQLAARERNSLGDNSG